MDGHDTAIKDEGITISPRIHEILRLNHFLGGLGNLFNLSSTAQEASAASDEVSGQSVHISSEDLQGSDGDDEGQDEQARGEED